MIYTIEHTTELAFIDIDIIIIVNVEDGEIVSINQVYTHDDEGNEISLYAAFTSSKLLRATLDEIIKEELGIEQ